MKLNTAAELIDDIRRGKMVVIMDDEARENEGDIVIAAERVRPEDINFMAKNARGLICLTLTRDRCEFLQLPLMVNDNRTRHQTRFTVSIEAASGVTTGISAADRARTIQVAVAKGSQPEDIIQPGHIFPIMAQPGGVLRRAGHTEAGCDLARLAGCAPAAAIVEIMNEDGSMARRPDLEAFASAHSLKIGTIADLIHYRLANEHTVTRTTSHRLDTSHGKFDVHSYEDSISGSTHLAFTLGEISADEPTLVRVHIPQHLARCLPSGQRRAHELVLRRRACADPRGGRRSRRAALRRRLWPGPGFLDGAGPWPAAAAAVRGRSCAATSPSARARRFCAISASARCACSAIRRDSTRFRGFDLEVTGFVRFRKPRNGGAGNGGNEGERE